MKRKKIIEQSQIIVFIEHWLLPLIRWRLDLETPKFFDEREKLLRRALCKENGKRKMRRPSSCYQESNCK